MKKKIKSKGLGVFIILFLIFFFLIYFNSFSHLRSVLTDKLYSGKEALGNIVIIEIDDGSINKIGRWPWNRDVFSKILDNIEEAKVIGIDLSFFEESEDDEYLKKRLSSLNNIVLAAEIINNKLYIPIFNNDFGYVNLKADSDGVIRKVNSNLRQEVLPFAFEIYKKGWDSNFKPLKKEYIINFADKFSKISAYELLNNKKNFENKFVLIGVTAPDIHDIYIVPTSNGIAMSGVEINANILQNLILDNFLEKQDVISILISVFLVGLFGMFVLSRLKIYYSIPIALIIIIIYSIMGIFIFSKLDYIVDMFFFPLALLLFTGTGISINYIEEKRHSAYLTNAFGKYINKDLLKEIITHKSELKLGGDKHTITIFFTDIRNFTSISEKLKPEELVHLLNGYFTEMTKIILENKGTVDKFIGDAIMAFWNAPLIEEKHAQLACKTALQQIKTLKLLKEEWKKENFPMIEIGCGIHTGEAIIGNMGSEDRFDYTAIGDNINLGSRIEGLTKQYGVNVIISQTTYEIVKDEFEFRKLDAVKVKGKKIPIIIHELCIDYDEKFNLQYEKALYLYFESNFKKALKEFEAALKIKKDDQPCKLFIKRCKVYIKNPPGKDWDGVFEFKTK